MGGKSILPRSAGLCSIRLRSSCGVLCAETAQVRFKMHAWPRISTFLLQARLKRAQSKTMPDLQHEGARIGGGAIYGQLLVLPVSDRPNKTVTAVGEYDICVNDICQ